MCLWSSLDKLLPSSCTLIKKLIKKLPKNAIISFKDLVSRALCVETVLIYQISWMWKKIGIPKNIPIDANGRISSGIILKMYMAEFIYFCRPCADK